MTHRRTLRLTILGAAAAALIAPGPGRAGAESTWRVLRYAGYGDQIVEAGRTTPNSSFGAMTVVPGDVPAPVRVVRLYGAAKAVEINDIPGLPLSIVGVCGPSVVLTLSGDGKLSEPHEFCGRVNLSEDRLAGAEYLIVYALASRVFPETNNYVDVNGTFLIDVS